MDADTKCLAGPFVARYTCSMSQDFEAIFQNGVLRPLQPVA
ncbi:MAG: antitoxin family protein, partial [Planctomycetaceae bacterium]|nr:antitoxin family protein [Planctomycetaceae bacterium]